MLKTNERWRCVELQFISICNDTIAAVFALFIAIDWEYVIMAGSSLAAAELLLVVGLLGWFFYSQQAASKRTAQLKQEQEPTPTPASDSSPSTRDQH
ncbi:hypothetical protein CKO12_07925 [Chromatium okenii]|nr:hypothetical protein [Chromatium okenii]